MINQLTFNSYKSYCLKKIKESQIKNHPFYNIFIEGIFPDELYNRIYENFITKIYNDKYLNKKISTKDINSEEPSLEYIYALFSDIDIKIAIIKKFYVYPGKIPDLYINPEEMQFSYVSSTRKQDIHVDMPFKFISFVFYLPKHEFSHEDAKKNGTMMYDKNLNKVYNNKYIENSVTIFAPHFYSYHRYDVSCDRAALIMFYNNKNLEPSNINDLLPPPTEFKNTVYNKLSKYPLLEYNDPQKLMKEFVECKVNTIAGRIR